MVTTVVLPTAGRFGAVAAGIGAAAGASTVASPSARLNPIKPFNGAGVARSGLTRQRLDYVGKRW